MAALPPSKVSKSIKCEAGVVPLPDNLGYAAFVSWQGKPGTRYEESLGVKQKPWFAGVAHDVAFCSRAYHAGDRQLRGVQHAGSSGRSDGERLNFPLSCFVDQPAFWAALDMSFGELVMKLRTSRELEKILFFGDEMQPGLGEQRLAAERQRQQQAEPLPPPQQQREPAAPARRGHQAASGAPRSDAADKPQRSAPGSAAGLAPAATGAAKVGHGAKPEVPSLPPKQQENAQVAAAAHGDQQQQQQGHSPEKAAASPPPAAQQPAAASKPSAPAVAAVAAAGPPAEAAGVANHVNGGLATSSGGSEKGEAAARKQEPQQQEPQQQPTAPAAYPSTSPGKPKATKPAGVAAAGPGSPRAGKAPREQPAQQQVQPAQQQVQQAQPQQQQGPQQPLPPRPGKEAEPKTVWGKPAEFPAGSNKYPFYLKEGPLSKGYYTISTEADIVLLGRHEGAVTLRDAATGKSWPVKTHLKRAGASESRYLTATTAFNRENELRPHDVLWLSAGEPHGQQLLFGVWRWGSPEAAAFKAHLGSGKPGSGKKRTRAQMLQDVAAAAAAAGNGGGAGPSEEEEQPKRQQKQQKTGSTSSSEDVPLYSPPQRPAGARALSPATAKAAIEELFEDDDG